MTEIAIHAPGAQRMGFFTDTTVHRLQGVRGRLQAVERPARRRRRVPQGRLLRPHRRARRGDLAPRALRRARRADTRPDVRPRRDARRADAVERVAGFGDWVFMSDVCKHCTNAGCLDACPTGALIRTEFETVVLQPDVCNGCGYCIPSCPFGVVDRDPDDGRAAKCTLCYDRLEDGLEPACAKACPTDSIQFGPYDELVERRRAARRHAARARRRGRLPLRRRRRARAQLAGGLGAFFLLTEPPERYGLPAQADSPIQENVVPATLAAVGAGLLPRRAAASAARASLLARGARDERRARHDPGRVGTRRRRPAFGERAVEGAQRRRCTAARLGRRRAGRTSTRTTRATPTTRGRPRGASPRPPRRARDRAARPTSSRGRSSSRRCGRGRCRCTSGSAGSRPGSSFVALACDLAGDHRSARGRARGRARRARRPRPPLLILDLGRPGALPTTCCASSSRARRCRWARGR